MKPLRFVGTFLVISAACTSVGRAQFDSQYVSGTGTVTITHMPETMRLQIAIIGRGATLKDALAALKDRTGKAKTQLITLGADKDSMKVTEPRITELPNSRNQQQQMMAMMRQRRAGGKAPTKGQPAPPVLVMSQLTADWKLNSKSNEELLLAVHPIQEKVKSADIAGMKEAEKLTPEQEEMLEEAEQDYSFSSSDEHKPGEPIFMFVSTVSEEERDKAMAEAFSRAKMQATRLAAAAGAKLGTLQSVHSGNPLGGDYEDYSSYGYNSNMYRMMQLARRQQGNNPEAEQSEAIGVEPAQVKFHVSITAAFNLAEKK